VGFKTVIQVCKWPKFLCGHQDQLLITVTIFMEQRVLIVKMIAIQLVKKFHIFHGSQKFTKAHH